MDHFSNLKLIIEVVSKQDHNRLYNYSIVFSPDSRINYLISLYSSQNSYKTCMYSSHLACSVMTNTFGKAALLPGQQSKRKLHNASW